MGNDKSGDEEKSDTLPPVDGMEYPEKPSEDAPIMEKMKWMERVDTHWQKRGFQKLEHN